MQQIKLLTLLGLTLSNVCQAKVYSNGTHIELKFTKDAFVSSAFIQSFLRINENRLVGVAPPPSSTSPKPPSSPPKQPSSPPKQPSSPPKQPSSPPKQPSSPPKQPSSPPKQPSSPPKQPSSPKQATPPKGPTVQSPRCSKTGTRQKVPPGRGKASKDVKTCTESKGRTKRSLLLPANGVEFFMNGPPKMAVFEHKDPLFTQGLGGCTVGIIASPTHAFGVHVARGYIVTLANGSVGYAPGGTPIEMATAAGNRLVQLWRENQAAAGHVKAMVLSAAEMSEYGDDSANAMYMAIQAYIPATAWSTYSAAYERSLASGGFLGVWGNLPNFPKVAMGEIEHTACFSWP